MNKIGKCSNSIDFETEVFKGEGVTFLLPKEKNVLILYFDENISSDVNIVNVPNLLEL